jgi:transcriptional regulator with XRE-family HTH domain
MTKRIGKALAARVKSLRESAGLSQQELATRADLSLSQVAKLEQGKKADPRASTLLALAAALRVKPGQVLEDLVPAEELVAAAPADGDPGKQSKKKGKGKKGKKQRAAGAVEDTAGVVTGLNL